MCKYRNNNVDTHVVYYHLGIVTFLTATTVYCFH